jgi:hypothetical protein
MLVKEARERVNVTSADCLDQRYGEDIVTGQSSHISSSPAWVHWVVALFDDDRVPALWRF